MMRELLDRMVWKVLQWWGGLNEDQKFVILCSSMFVLCTIAFLILNW